MTSLMSRCLAPSLAISLWDKCNSFTFPSYAFRTVAICVEGGRRSAKAGGEQADDGDKADEAGAHMGHARVGEAELVKV